MNSNATSKINWTAGILLVINIVNQLGYLPEGMAEQLVDLVNAAGLILIGIFRSFFTKKDA